MCLLRLRRSLLTNDDGGSSTPLSHSDEPGCAIPMTRRRRSPSAFLPKANNMAWSRTLHAHGRSHCVYPRVHHAASGRPSQSGPPQSGGALSPFVGRLTTQPKPPSRLGGTQSSLASEHGLMVRHTASSRGSMRRRFVTRPSFRWSGPFSPQTCRTPKRRDGRGCPFTSVTIDYEQPRPERL